MAQSVTKCNHFKKMIEIDKRKVSYKQNFTYNIDTHGFSSTPNVISCQRTSPTNHRPILRPIEKADYTPNQSKDIHVQLVGSIIVVTNEFYGLAISNLSKIVDKQEK